MEETEYKNFFEEFKKFRELQNKQKESGLNDFNLLTTVLKYDDEVRLHSRMIGNLIDPHSKHYQGTLFLEKFLKEIDLLDWGLNLANVKVYIEYHNIDLYVTDGIKHIIIENKIWAKDQPCQLIKYINIIKEEYDLREDNSDIPKIEDIYTIYLTPRDKECPKEHKVENGYISGIPEKLDECSNKEKKLENYQTKYKKITYKEEIISWLDSIYSEVYNILNLSEAIKQYRSVVEIVIDEHKGNVMTLKEYLVDNKSLYENIGGIKNEIDNLKDDINKDFWDDLAKKLDTEFDLDDKHEKVQTRKFERLEFEYKQKGILIEREHNLYIYIDDMKLEEWTNWNYIKFDGNYNQKDNDVIDMKNGNKNFWKLGDVDIRTKLIDDIMQYIKENT